MSRSDPPPRRTTTLSMGVTRPVDSPAEKEQEEAWPGDEGATSEEGEGDVMEISLDELQPVTIPPSSDRVTVVPPVSEQEYVAEMMRGLPASDRLPISRAITPPRSMTPPIGSMVVPPSRTSSPRSAPEPAFAAPRVPSSVPPASAAPPSSGPQRRTFEQPTSTYDAPPSSRPAVTQKLHAPGVAREPEPVLTLDLAESIPPRAHARGHGLAHAASPIEIRPPVLDDVNIRERPTERPLSPAPPPKTSVESTQEPEFGPVSGDALELVGARVQSVRPVRSPSISMRAVRDRFDVGDFSGALILAEGMLDDNPEHVDALLYAEHCRDVLKPMYMSRLGGTGRILALAIGPEQMRWLSLDHRAGFLLSLIDGRSTVDEVLDMSGMSELEALRLLLQLLQQNVIKPV